MGAQRRHVRAGLGLGVAECEVDLAGVDAGQPLALLLFVADAHDRRRDRGDGQRQHRRPGRFDLVDEDPLLDRALLEPAVLLRPGDAPPAGVAERAVKTERERAAPLVALEPRLAREARIDVLANEGPHLVTPGRFTDREFVVHARKGATASVECKTRTRPTEPAGEATAGER